MFARGYVLLACCGFAFAWQDGLTGSAWGDWANYTASPLRAFENELGVQPPLGFWDPLGFTADGDVNFFERRRQSEIKHGRIAMLATMGYITPEPLSCTKRFRIAFGRGSNYSMAFAVLSHRCAHAPIDMAFHLSKDHWQVSRIFVAICWPEICRHPERPCGCLQDPWLGDCTDPCLHGLLRGFPRPVSRHPSRSGRLRLQGLDV